MDEVEFLKHQVELIKEFLEKNPEGDVEVLIQIWIERHAAFKRGEYEKNAL